MAQKKAGVLNAILSTIIDRPMRQFAERLAASVSEESWLRSEFAERLLSGVKGLAEGYEKTGLGGVVVEKATDFLDFAAGGLFEKTAAGPSQAGRGWMDRFLRYVEKTIAETSPTDLVAVRARLEQEFAIRKAIVELVESAAREAQPERPKPEPIDWVAVRARFGAADTKVAGTLNDWLGKAKAAKWLK